ncbi:MAG TPA: DNA topoisomerase I [Candidatus Saccharimonadales bacterium]|nr:DNA topoisomerase I [Candidatus Saccharimonadales bacterium]
MDKLIIAEKPSVALRIALSLSETKPKTNAFNGVVYYEAYRKGEKLYIVAAAGHLFTLHQRQRSNELPIFDIEWIPSYKINKKAYFTKKYLDAIEEVGRKCGFFINACDYDIEGTIIGSNLIKDITNRDVNKEISEGLPSVGRMKFSTTTKPDLEEAYENMAKFDYNNMYAGEARHKLDWMWGINMSRVLMNALYLGGVKKIMSIGRVQGPTLGILAKRELEIKGFVPRPFWTVLITYKGMDFQNKRGSIFEKEAAEKALKETKSNKITVKELGVSEETRYPFPPFDLTSLQLEASRAARMDPTRTLAVAQSLYERSYISYPRTASQKLPATLNLGKILSLVAQNDKYSDAAKRLIAEKRFRPREGAKEDEAHPAIHPTGENPKTMSDEEEAVYDIITKRFLACFAEPALIENTRAVLSAGSEEYSASGNVIKKKGWMEIYNYYKPDENLMPAMEKGEEIKHDKILMKEGKTEPPKRYTKASLIALLEKKDLGTKATRAAIIDTLFNRGYILNARIEVTEFGMSVYESLDKYCSQILDEELTKKLDKDMERISRGSLKKEEVIDEGKKIITGVVETFKKNGREIGRELSKGLKESEVSNVLGRCRCGNGDLVIKKSRNNKQFVGCSNWPTCNNSYPLPQYAKIVPLHKTCEKCGTPKIKVFAKGKVFEMDLDPNCETKKNWNSSKAAAEARAAEADKVKIVTAKDMIEKGGKGASEEGEAKPGGPTEEKKKARKPRKPRKKKEEGEVV